jgi:aerobic C4-dicarboxylate transport protein
VDGVGFILGIDRFMSEARALTNFAGNAVATVLIGTWTRQFDREQAKRVFDGDQPFNEATLVDDHTPAPELPRQAAGKETVSV